MKKKVFALALCAAICLTAGCGKRNETPSAPTAVSTPDTGRTPETSTTVSKPNTSTADSPTNTSTAGSMPETSTADSTPNSTSTAESTPEPDVSVPDAENGGISRGRWNGDVFTSDFFGLTITIDKDCTKGTDEMLAMLNGMTDMSDADFIAAVERNKNIPVYDLSVQYQETGNTILLGYSKYEGVTLDEYVEANVYGLEVSEMFEDIRTEMLNVSGKTHPCVYATLPMGEIDIREAMVFYQNGDYFAIVTFSTLNSSDLQRMITNMLG